MQLDRQEANHIVDRLPENDQLRIAQELTAMKNALSQEDQNSRAKSQLSKQDLAELDCVHRLLVHF